MGQQMNKFTLGIVFVCLMFDANADAQSLSNRATATVNGVGSVGGGATAGLAGTSGGSQTSSSTNPVSGSGPSVGGNLPGALGIKAGNRIIELRGAASVGDDRGNVKAGVGIPF
jgi:hypothetical protein